MPKKKYFSIFSQIIAKKLPAKIHYEDKDFIVFDDIHPQAPIHVLIVPKKELAFLEDLPMEEIIFMGKILQVARQVAKKLKTSKNYRLIMNVGPNLQDVHHIHLHLMGGFKK